jgi:hypothetical protein
MTFLVKNQSSRPGRYSAFVALTFVGWFVGGKLEYVRGDDPGNQKPAAKSATNEKNSLDDELMKGLSNDLLDGLDDLPKIKPGTKSTSTTQRPTDVAKPAEDKKAGGIEQPTDGEDLGQPSEDQTTGKISRQMRDVERRISNSQSGGATQQKQQAISDELAKLIEQLKKATQSSQKPGSGNSPSSQRSKVAQGGQKAGSQRQSDKPAKDSSSQMRHDEAAKADPAAIRERMKEAWGNLPERIREQMMQSSVDDFLPKYELLIEKYFQRLSEDETPKP